MDEEDLYEGPAAYHTGAIYIRTEQEAPGHTSAHEFPQRAAALRRDRSRISPEYRWGESSRRDLTS